MELPDDILLSFVTRIAHVMIGLSSRKMWRTYRAVVARARSERTVRHIFAQWHYKSQRKKKLGSYVRMVKAYHGIDILEDESPALLIGPVSGSLMLPARAESIPQLMKFSVMGDTVELPAVCDLIYGCDILLSNVNSSALRAVRCEIFCHKNVITSFTATCMGDKMRITFPFGSIHSAFIGLSGARLRVCGENVLSCSGFCSFIAPDATTKRIEAPRLMIDKLLMRAINDRLAGK